MSRKIQENLRESLVGKFISTYLVESVLNKESDYELYLVKDESGNYFSARLIAPEFMFYYNDLFEKTRNLSHKGIIFPLEIAEEDDRSYLITEFVAGETLEEAILKMSKIDILTAVENATLIAESCRYLVEKGVNLQKLHPANIVITEYGSVKIVDIITEPTALRKKDERSSKVHYVAPEVISGKKSSGRELIFSFGALVYFMMTGKHPYKRESGSGLLRGEKRTQPVKPSSLNRDIVRIIDQFILKCMDVDPLQRYSSLDQVLDGLRSIRKELKFKDERVIYKPGRKFSFYFLGFVFFMFLLSIIVISHNEPDNFGYTTRISFQTKRMDIWGNVVSFRIDRKEDVYANDGFRLNITPGEDLFFYFLNFSPDGTVKILYPLNNNWNESFLQKGKDYIIPSDKQWYQVDDVPGTEELIIAITSSRWEELELMLEGQDKMIAKDRKIARLKDILKEAESVTNLIFTGENKTYQLSSSSNESSPVFSISGNDIAVYSILLKHK